ncbi:MAG: thiamine pyrophosphate-binding protein [Deltaproteobacteria bacterium CG2_30_63_29]|nr:MAG: thiamine pyrophosphate-binding protein [Deltaproteobacteria bacterium CG2_30_63_29]PIW00615.1 MAG: thiamine pyrophosphate-binding protein [Deltaproteobacteria bacterium CG17_big_fil_post_rev_8_21_14_2_50_63_7]
MKKVIGGEWIAAMLAKEGVDTVFGIIDGTYMGLYVAFEKYGVKLVSPRHETSAAHMAGAYARLTGKLGVCMASNGPGVANILPGVAVENAEGNRVLLLTSCRRQGIAYPDRGGAYQCFDQVGVTSAMSKYSAYVPNFERIGELMRQALRVSYQGRPGVVHLDIPENVINGAFDVEELDVREPSSYRSVEPAVAGQAQVERAAELLRTAKNPVIHAGSGVLHAQASTDLVRLAALLQSPVATSWAARGAISDNHELGLPLYAMEAINFARSQADVVLVLGSRLGETDWWGKMPYWGDPAVQKMIQVDLDEANIGRNKPATEAVVADCGVFLSQLCTALEEKPVAAPLLASRRAWCADLAEKKQAKRAGLDMALQNRSTPMHSAQVPAACRKFFNDDDVIVIDGGNTAVWSAFFHDVRKPNTIMSTFKMGMLGAGVSQAIGAKVARPDSQVYCVIGDGAMGFHLQEVETALRAGTPVVYLVLCDKQWGMVKLTQQMTLGTMRPVMGLKGYNTINADLGEIAFDKVAQAMGCHGERVANPDDLQGALERSIASGLPAVIHVDVDPGMHLFAPGLQEFKAMHQEPAGK